MIYLLVCGHGQVAEGLVSGLRILAGEVPHCQAINFSEGMSSETLSHNLQAAIQSAGDEAVLILTDIIGGTPFREAVLLAQKRSNCEVISGVNVHMLVEAAIERDDAQSLEALVEHLITSSREGIMRYQAKQRPTSTSADDGI